MDSTPLTLAVAALVGYLLGSLSGARIIGRRRDAGDLTRTRVVLDGSGSSVETHGVSPSALQARQGGKSGLPAGAIDIAKALLPTLVARLIWPDTPEYVVVAAAALVGHVYPIYYRFVGGYGISPLLGGLVVIDWRAPLVSIALFGVLGLIAGSAYLGIETWPIGLIAYFALWGDGWTVSYALVANVLYWWRSRAEAIGAIRSFARDPRPWRERIGDFKKYPDYEVPEPS